MAKKASGFPVRPHRRCRWRSANGTARRP